MLKVFLVCALVALTIALSILKKCYSQIGKNEDFPSSVRPNSKRALHYIARNISLVSILLSALILLLAALSAVLLGVFMGFGGLAVAYPLLVFVLMLVPRAKASKISKKLAFSSAPLIRNITEKTHPLAKALEPFLNRFGGRQTDTGIYTNDDLVELLGKQKHAANNSISQKELGDLIKRLELGKKNIEDGMKPLKDLKIVGSSEQIGPVLINELHETGQQYFLVEEEFNNEVVGILNVAKLTDLKKTGDVKTAMDDNLYYLNKSGSLIEVIDAFSKTGSHAFVVINKRQKIVGLLTIEDTIGELINAGDENDFDMFDVKEAVAKGEQWDEDEA
jgi:CBS domain containing-hemolysin-like protein